MSQLRLLIVSLNYAPEPTATGKYTGEMAAWLARQGHEVHAIAGFPHYPQWQIEDAYKGRGWFVESFEGVTTYRVPLYVPSMKTLSAKNRILMESSFSVSSLRWWMSFLFTKRFDVVIGICPPLQDAAIPWFYKSLRGVPFVFHIQDLQVDAALNLGMLSSLVLKKLLLSSEAFLLNRATKISTITEAMRKRIIQKGIPETKTILFPNWADTSFVQPKDRNNPLRKKLGAGKEDMLVVYAGNMGEKQGLEIVLDAAERLKSLSHIKFALIGQGAKRETLEQEAISRNLSNLRFFDVFPWEQVPDMLAAGDIHLVIQKRKAGDLVMPSKMTNIMAAGRPTLATAEAGTALYEVLETYQAGVSCTPENPDALAASIKTMANLSEKCIQMGHNARQYAERFIAKGAILAAFESELKHIAEQ
jgi:colanic acid biosynthesis glycosyl transferase WcaI